MTSVCPVCNGLQSLSARCPRCSCAAEDEGRLNDCFGPYSPYRPIEDVGLTNGFTDVRNHVCVHVARCPGCRHSFRVFVHEWQS